jgi:hypothetical protein
MGFPLSFQHVDNVCYVAGTSLMSDGTDWLLHAHVQALH